jgi:Zn-dependent protease
MNLLSWTIPLGRIAGINIRAHVALLLLGFYFMSPGASLLSGLVYLAGLYVSVLLHELGHAFAARWCDGDCDEILLWPLGGLAYARTPADPTAHLITAAAGPAVSLALWAAFTAIAKLLAAASATYESPVLPEAYFFFVHMAYLNMAIIVFNLIPAYPMDGGRILKALLCYRISFERAAQITAVLGMVIAALFVAYGVMNQQVILACIGAFVFMQSSTALKAPGLEGTAGRFSISERLRRGRRSAQFSQSVASAANITLHRCAKCDRTEASHPDLEFRVAGDGEEYCAEHLPRRD